MAFYNIYIEQQKLGRIKDYRIALPEEELNLLVQAFLNGKESHRVKGKLIDIKHPKAFIIYSITDKSLGFSKESIEAKMNAYKSTTTTKKMSLSIYRRFGANVTFDFLKGMEWGALKDNNTHSIAIAPLKNKTGMKIFISHSSKDAQIVTPLVDLLESMGVKHHQIFYSSHPSYGVDLGENIFERLKKELDSEVLVLFILSENFYSSPICLCEMGATWIKTNKHIPILIPPFDFNKVQGVFPNILGFSITDTKQLNNLKSRIEKDFDLPPIDTNRWEEKRAKFLSEIQIGIKNTTNGSSDNIKQTDELIDDRKNSHSSQSRKNDIKPIFQVRGGLRGSDEVTVNFENIGQRAFINSVEEMADNNVHFRFKQSIVVDKEKKWILSGRVKDASIQPIMYHFKLHFDDIDQNKYYQIIKLYQNESKVELPVEITTL